MRNIRVKAQDALIPIQRILPAKTIGQAQDSRRVLHFSEFIQRLPSAALGGGVGGDQLGMRAFKLL